VKIASRRTPYGDRLCFADLVPHRLIDIQAAFVRRLETTTGVHSEDARLRARLAVPCDLPTLLRADPALDDVRRVFDWCLDHLDGGELYEDCLWSDEPGRLGSPVGRPRTVWTMLAAYPRDRPRAEGGVGPAGSPGAAPARRAMQGCLKAVNALAGPRDDLLHPVFSSRVDPEIELAVVVGRRSRRLDLDSALDAVAGYVAFCDTGARDISELDNNRMDRGKGCDTFGITGPWFVTADEVPDPHDVRIRSWVNGEVRQDASTADLLYSIPEQLAWLTAAMTLEPGDVLSTGAPAGHNVVQPGDVVRGEVDGLGVIETKVVLDDAADAVG
jgi:hypothetical protein